MNKLPKILFSFFILIIFGCNSDRQVTEKTAQTSTKETLQLEKNEGNKIDYEKTKVLKIVYVIDREGTIFREQTDENSKAIGSYEFGKKLDVIEENKEWFGVRDRITREFLRNGSKIENTSWERVYVLKSKVGSINDIVLGLSDLNIISSLTINQKTEYFEKGNQLKEYLSIELIDKPLFDEMKKTSIDFLIADTVVNKKKNGTITLNCQDNVVKFIDKPDAEESRQEFKYIGQIESINQYLIGGSYWESIDYRFIDKTTGEETKIFGEYPNISPGLKHIISIYTNPYESTADLELHSIDNKNIKHVMSASFKFWMPSMYQNQIFWSSDGYLYLKVNHINSFWKESGDLNDEGQYIRMRIM